VKDGERTIRIFMHSNIRFDVVRARWTLRDLKRATTVRNRVVARDDAGLLNAQDINKRVGIAYLHEPALSCGIGAGRANSLLCMGRYTSRMYWFAAAISVMPNSRNSLARRLCSVPNARSLRPRASGE